MGKEELFEVTRVSMEVIVTSDRKLVYKLFRGRIQPTDIGVIIHLPSTMDIPVGSGFFKVVCTRSHPSFVSLFRAVCYLEDHPRTCFSGDRITPIYKP